LALNHQLNASTIDAVRRLNDLNIFFQSHLDTDLHCGNICTENVFEAHDDVEVLMNVGIAEIGGLRRSVRKWMRPTLGREAKRATERRSPIPEKYTVSIRTRPSGNEPVERVTPKKHSSCLDCRYRDGVQRSRFCKMPVSFSGKGAGKPNEPPDVETKSGLNSDSSAD